MAECHKKEIKMKKLITRTLCAILMLAMLVPMIGIMASAADLTNLYDASKAVCGTPNSAQRDTAPTNNANYYCSEPIYVKAGDVITVGPVHKDQGYYFTTYKADGSAAEYTDYTTGEIFVLCNGHTVTARHIVTATNYPGFRPLETGAVLPLMRKQQS